MSAWIVAKKHIDLIVAAVQHGTRDGVRSPRLRPLSPPELDRLGQMLVDECVTSVRYRYPDDQPGNEPGPCDGYYLKPYVYEDPGYLPTAAELHKAIDCYYYQSCEHPGWKQSKAKELCDAMQAAIGAKVRACRAMLAADKRHDYNPPRWPEYEQAPWGFDAEEIEACKARQRAEQCAALGVDPNITDKALHDLLEERGL